MCVCVCMRACMCVCVCERELRMVSMDKILRFTLFFFLFFKHTLYAHITCISPHAHSPIHPLSLYPAHKLTSPAPSQH